MWAGLARWSGRAALTNLGVQLCFLFLVQLPEVSEEVLLAALGQLGPHCLPVLGHLQRGEERGGEEGVNCSLEPRPSLSRFFYFAALEKYRGVRDKNLGEEGLGLRLHVGQLQEVSKAALKQGRIEPPKVEGKLWVG